MSDPLPAFDLSAVTARAMTWDSGKLLKEIRRLEESLNRDLAILEALDAAWDQRRPHRGPR